MTIRKIMLAGLALLWAPVAVFAQSESIVLQSTTSTAQSGFYDYILPQFAADTGITVHVVAVGTGQAIQNARNCDGDVLLVHARAAEQQFVADGAGTERRDVMYNDFVVVGPGADPAGINGLPDVTIALTRIARHQSLFASRGDGSGTHLAEQALWAETDVTPTDASGLWYREMGAGMGATLNAAVGMGAYTLTDRATWISFGNKQDFRQLVQGDARLFNQYGVIPVNPAHCPSVRHAAALRFADWLVSERGQAAIAGFSVDGQQLFFPNAASLP